MMNNNKILTVSYGTFSCTLEGFDDSFDTMKAIAEYFRDLASDDRYFGAEPPQPDAEMLARIAEREVSRRVEAREHEGRIMLKAHEESVRPEAEYAAAQPPVAAAAVATSAAIAQPAAAPAAQPEIPAPQDTQAFSAPYTDTPKAPAEAPAAPEPVAEDTSIPDDTAPAQATVTENVEAETTEETDAGANDTVAGVAAFFADSAVDDAGDPETEEAISVEAFTGYISSEAEAEAEADDDNVASQQAAAGAALDEAASDDAGETDFAHLAVSVPDVALTENMGAEEDAHGDVVNTAADDDTDTEEFETFEVEDYEPAPTRQESFADKLARIRAVVSKQDDDAENTGYEDEAEDEPDSPVSGGFAAMDTDLNAPYTRTASDHVDTHVVAEAAQDIEDALDIDDATAADDADEQDLSSELDDLDDVLRRYDAMDDADANEEDMDEASSEGTDDQDGADAEENLFGDAEADAESNTDETIHARVMKVNRAQLDAALEAGELEEYEDEALANTHALSDEDEDELQKALADVEAEGHTIEDDTATADADAEEAPVATRGSLPSIDDEAEQDVSRLMAEADQQMAEPEGRTRRSAFAHLRAAVAARFADKSMDHEEQKTAEKAEAYRSDLADVVKPRRPASGEHRSQRPSDAQKGPLKLVAEQRIHVDAPAMLNMIAPRRVAASDEEEDDLTPDTGFAAYAEERGASTLPELLEAAASYLCFVEGHEEFSRPQLMTRVRQAECGDFSREDGLRSFGQLLRTGKIEKIKGGRFVTSDAIGYKPDHRAAG